jgi:hypothetical protein
MGTGVVQQYRISTVLQGSRRCIGIQVFRMCTGVHGYGANTVVLG